MVHTDIKNLTTLKVIGVSSNKLCFTWGSKPNALILPKRAQNTKQWYVVWYRVTHGSRTFLEQIVHGKWLWEGDELEVFPPLMECQSSHNGAVDVTTSFVHLR